jgi:glyoxalase superfamily protein
VAHDHRRTRSTFCRRSQALDNRAQCRELSAGARANGREIHNLKPLFRVFTPHRSCLDLVRSRYLQGVAPSVLNRRLPSPSVKSVGSAVVFTSGSGAAERESCIGGKPWRLAHFITADGKGVLFQQITGYNPPRWPDPAYPQQAHLDILVDELDTGEARALQLGASRLSGGGKTFRVFADRAGHSFCLTV